MKQLVTASSLMDEITVDQMLAWVCAIMMDDDRSVVAVARPMDEGRH